jgi:hypothetical protein
VLSLLHSLNYILPGLKHHFFLVTLYFHPKLTQPIKHLHFFNQPKGDNSLNCPNKLLNLVLSNLLFESKDKKILILTTFSHLSGIGRLIDNV